MPIFEDFLGILNKSKAGSGYPIERAFPKLEGERTLQNVYFVEISSTRTIADKKAPEDLVITIDYHPEVLVDPYETKSFGRAVENGFYFSSKPSASFRMLLTEKLESENTLSLRMSRSAYWKLLIRNLETQGVEGGGLTLVNTKKDPMRHHRFLDWNLHVLPNPAAGNGRNLVVSPTFDLMESFSGCFSSRSGNFLSICEDLSQLSEAIARNLSIYGVTEHNISTALKILAQANSEMLVSISDLSNRPQQA